MNTTPTPSVNEIHHDDFGPDAVTSYYREGYLVVRGVLPKDVCDRAIAARQEQQTETAGGRWKPSIFDPAKPLSADEYALHEPLAHPRIERIVAALLEEEARLYYGMLAVVPGGGGSGLKWHQDNMYGNLLGRALNTFCALCDITPDMANLWVAPRTHRYGTNGDFTTQDGDWEKFVVEDPPTAMLLPALDAGDACIFTRDTLHRSLTNDTDRDRFAYASQWCAANCRRAETGEPCERAMPAADFRAMIGVSA